MKTNNLFTALFCIGMLASPALTGATQEGNYTPLKIYQTVDPVFPRHLVQQERTGEARIAIRIDAAGKLTDHLIIGYTRKAFANAAIEAIQDWRFEPAKLNNQPIPSVSELSFDFAATGVVVSMDLTEAVQSFYSMAFSKKHYDYALCTLKDIDRIPVPLSVVPPIYPGALPKQGVLGKVRITFFIDEQGAVRLPAVIEADDYVLAEFALDAISKWKFEPPTRQGKPTLVKASQIFNFEPGLKVQPKDKS